MILEQLLTADLGSTAKLRHCVLLDSHMDDFSEISKDTVFIFIVFTKFLKMVGNMLVIELEKQKISVCGID